MVCIAIAYLYYALVILSATWGQMRLAHTLLALCTGPMYYCYYKSWRGDPGIIAPQPDLVLQVCVCVCVCVCVIW